MIPMGDAKGAALALIVEILCATLTGANHSSDASSFFEAEGTPPGVGHTLIAFDPSKGGEGFGARLEALLSMMLAQDGVRLPGAGRPAKRAAADRDGVTVPAHLLDEIKALG